MDNLKNTVADGGYGWVVFSAACIVQFIVSGLQSNFVSSMYIYILKDLSDGRKAKAGNVLNALCRFLDLKSCTERVLS